MQLQNTNGRSLLKCASNAKMAIMTAASVKVNSDVVTKLDLGELHAGVGCLFVQLIGIHFFCMHGPLSHKPFIRAI